MVRSAVRLCLLGILLVSGCATALSPEVRREATPIQGYAQVRESPETYRGKTLILGGEILEPRNRAEATVFAVLERPLDAFRRPREVDQTGGRFLVRFDRYLDPAVFAPGRQVTVAGVVTGTEAERVGEASYTYVSLEGLEVHLWPPRQEWVDDPWYRYPWWYHPGLGHRPW